jgi:hypothetical protein
MKIIILQILPNVFCKAALKVKFFSPLEDLSVQASVTLSRVDAIRWVALEKKTRFTS